MTINKLLQDVLDFHQKYGLDPQLDEKGLLLKEVKDFRLKFMDEEIQEWADSHERGVWGGDEPGLLIDSKASQLDAMVDLIYVALGTVVLSGQSEVFDEGWRRVHDANMKKVRVTSAEESKRGSSFDVRKPEGWEAPDHRDLIVRLK